MFDIFDSLLKPEVIIFLIPLAAIIGAVINKTQKARYEHEERMAKIENGIDPDAG